MYDLTLSCCVNKCPSKAGVNGARLFSFPESVHRPVQRNEWIQVIKKVNGAVWQPDSMSAVCSEHFVSKAPHSDHQHPDFSPTIFNVIMEDCDRSHSTKNATTTSKKTKLNIKTFALEFIKYDVLLEKSPITPEKRKAYQQLYKALDLDFFKVLTWEKRLRNFIEKGEDDKKQSKNKKYSLYNYNLPWVKQVEQRMKFRDRERVVEDEVQLQEQEQEPERTPVSPTLVIVSLCLAVKHRKQLNSALNYSDVARDLKLDVTVNKLHEVWIEAQKTALSELKASSRMGDSPSSAPLQLSTDISNLVLLYSDVDKNSLINEESVILPKELKALEFLLELIQTHRCEGDMPNKVRAQRWTRLHNDYLKSDREASIVVLQRRWHELALQARSRLAAHWRRTRSKQTITRATTKDNLPLPAPIHIQIFKRYPHIALKPFTSWKRQVESGIIIAEPLNKKELNKSEAQFDADPTPVVKEIEPSQYKTQSNDLHKKCLKDLRVNLVDMKDIHKHSNPGSSRNTTEINTNIQRKINQDGNINNNHEKNDKNHGKNGKNHEKNYKNHEKNDKNQEKNDKNHAKNDKNQEKNNETPVNNTSVDIPLETYFANNACKNTLNDISIACPIPSKIPKKYSFFGKQRKSLSENTTLNETAVQSIPINIFGSYNSIDSPTNNNTNTTLSKTGSGKYFMDRNRLLSTEFETVSDESEVESNIDKRMPAVTNTRNSSDESRVVEGSQINIDKVNQVNRKVLNAKKTPIRAPHPSYTDWDNPVLIESRAGIGLGRSSPNQQNSQIMRNTELLRRKREQEVDFITKMPTEKQLESLLDELTFASGVTKDLYQKRCCLARHHQEVNDERASKGETPLNIHEHKSGKCNCCCQYLIWPIVKSKHREEREALNNKILAAITQKKEELPQESSIKSLKKKIHSLDTIPLREGENSSAMLKSLRQKRVLPSKEKTEPKTKTTKDKSDTQETAKSVPPLIISKIVNKKKVTYTTVEPPAKIPKIITRSHANKDKSESRELSTEHNSTKNSSKPKKSDEDFSHSETMTKDSGKSKRKTKKLSKKSSKTKKTTKKSKKDSSKSKKTESEKPNTFAANDSSEDEKSRRNSTQSKRSRRDSTKSEKTKSQKWVTPPRSQSASSSSSSDDDENDFKKWKQQKSVKIAGLTKNDTDQSSKKLKPVLRPRLRVTVQTKPRTEKDDSDSENANDEDDILIQSANTDDRMYTTDYEDEIETNVIRYESDTSATDTQEGSRKETSMTTSDTNLRENPLQAENNDQVPDSSCSFGTIISNLVENPVDIETIRLAEIPLPPDSSCNFSTENTNLVENQVQADERQFGENQNENWVSSSNFGTTITNLAEDPENVGTIAVEEIPLPPDSSSSNSETTNFNLIENPIQAEQIVVPVELAMTTDCGTSSGTTSGPPKKDNVDKPKVCFRITFDEYKKRFSTDTYDPKSSAKKSTAETIQNNLTADNSSETETLENEVIVNENANSDPTVNENQISDNMNLLNDDENQNNENSTNEIDETSKEVISDNDKVIENLNTNNSSNESMEETNVIVNENDNSDPIVIESQLSDSINSLTDDDHLINVNAQNEIDITSEEVITDNDEANENINTNNSSNESVDETNVIVNENDNSDPIVDDSQLSDNINLLNDDGNVTNVNSKNKIDITSEEVITDNGEANENINTNNSTNESMDETDTPVTQTVENIIIDNENANSDPVVIEDQIFDSINLDTDSENLNDETSTEEIENTSEEVIPDNDKVIENLNTNNSTNESVDETNVIVNENDNYTNEIGITSEEVIIDNDEANENINTNNSTNESMDETNSSETETADNIIIDNENANSDPVVIDNQIPERISLESNNANLNNRSSTKEDSKTLEEVIPDNDKAIENLNSNNSTNESMDETDTPVTQTVENIIIDNESTVTDIIVIEDQIFDSINLDTDGENLNDETSTEEIENTSEEVIPDNDKVINTNNSTNESMDETDTPVTQTVENKIIDNESTVTNLIVIEDQIFDSINLVNNDENNENSEIEVDETSEKIITDTVVQNLMTDNVVENTSNIYTIEDIDETPENNLETVDNTINGFNVDAEETSNNVTLPVLVNDEEHSVDLLAETIDSFSLETTASPNNDNLDMPLEQSEARRQSSTQNGENEAIRSNSGIPGLVTQKRESVIVSTRDYCLELMNRIQNTSGIKTEAPGEMSTVSLNHEMGSEAPSEMSTVSRNPTTSANEDTDIVFVRIDYIKTTEEDQKKYRNVPSTSTYRNNTNEIPTAILDLTVEDTDVEFVDEFYIVESGFLISSPVNEAAQENSDILNISLAESPSLETERPIESENPNLDGDDNISPPNDNQTDDDSKRDEAEKESKNSEDPEPTNHSENNERENISNENNPEESNDNISPQHDNQTDDDSKRDKAEKDSKDSEVPEPTNHSENNERENISNENNPEESNDSNSKRASS